MKTTGKRVELIEKAILTKMISFIVVSGDTYVDALKKSHMYFNKLYHTDKEKVHGILLSDYQIARSFAKYIAELDGFKKFLMSPENVESIKKLTIEDMAETPDFNKSEFEKDCFKALGSYTTKGKSFDQSVEAIVSAFNKHKPEYGTVDKCMVVNALAEKCYTSLQNMKKNPLKNILFLVKLLSAEELELLKSKL
jgi:hypothetical protein